MEREKIARLKLFSHDTTNERRSMKNYIEYESKYSRSTGVNC